jgi:protein-S-isoprenylcysteine O-methyltransferase Ste14
MADVEGSARARASYSVARATLGVAAMTALFAALLFVPAGRLDWSLAWLYLGLLLAYVAASWACLVRWNPELIEHRLHVGPGTKTWDKLWAALFTPLLLAVYVVAGLEARDGAASLPLALWPLGLLLFVAGAALLTGSMVVNPFFEKTVRIQTERGHRVIDTGPYAIVRHPGYVGFLGWILGTPLLLGSAWALVPALLSLAGVVVRTALEDRTLRAELEGYEAYTQKVRFRLLPGVW